MKSIEEELLFFEEAPSLFQGHHDYLLTTIDPFIYLLSPKKPFPVLLPKSKLYPLMLMGGVHGNEPGGVAVLNQLMHLFYQGVAKTDIPIVFALGNHRALAAGKRFLEEDLNRCFGGSLKESPERDRAQYLEKVMGKSVFMLDFHQTQTPSDRSFFLTMEREKYLDFVSALDPHATVILQTPPSLGDQRLTATKFLYTQEGVGVTLELGVKGLDPLQIARGVTVGLQATAIATQRLQAVPHPPHREIFKGELYHFAHKLMGTELVPHTTNFQDVKKGQILGKVDGGNLLSPTQGKILFPKTGVQRDLAEPLCLIITPFSFSKKV